LKYLTFEKNADVPAGFRQSGRHMQGFGADAEVLDEPVIGFRLFSTAGVVLDAQQVGRMDGDKHGAAGRREDFAANLGESDGSAQYAARCRDAQGNDEIRLYQGALLIEPPTAPIDLVGVRTLVQAALASPLEFEMFDGIGDENLNPIKAGVSCRAVENAAGRPDEGATAQIFIIARLFPDEHDAGVERPLSGNNLSGVLIKRTPRAVRFCAAQLVQA
jgi:hypothetical protein